MGEKEKEKKNLERVSVRSFQESVSVGCGIRVAFSAESGGRVIDTTVVRHQEDIFWVAGLPKLSLPPDTLAQVIFTAEMAQYSFAGKVVSDAPKPDVGREIPLIALARPRAWRRNQRRMTFRLDSRFPVKTSPFGQPGEVRDGRSVNISASGVLIGLNYMFGIGDLLSVSFELPLESGEKEPFALEATVSRIPGEQEDETEFKIMHALNFAGMIEYDEERLAQGLWKMHKAGRGRKV